MLKYINTNIGKIINFDENLLMKSSLYTIIVISAIAIAFIFFILYVLFRKRQPSPLKQEDENDGLIYNAETGKYVTVEDLIEQHNLDYLDEQKFIQVYDALPENLKEILSLKDVETILELDYQLKGSELMEKDEYDDESKYEFLASAFEKKGKILDKTVFAKVITIYAANSIPK